MFDTPYTLIVENVFSDNTIKKPEKLFYLLGLF